MLGRLIAWLRIFGYDTKSALEFKPVPNEDTMLIEMAKKERRILLSKDRILVERAIKAGAEAVLIDSDDVKLQLEELLERYSLDIDPTMTRCTVCNAKLREAGEGDMDRIRNAPEVPDSLKNGHSGFWICEHCGKVYWQGSHWRNILKTAAEVKNDRDQSK